MTPHGILETVIYASDLEAAEAFYRDVLGFELQSKVDGRQLFYRCGDQMLLIFNAAATSLPMDRAARLPVPPHGARGAGHVCFRASAKDVSRWCSRLQSHGVEIESDFVWPGGGRSIYFRDPAGNCLEFAEPKIWGLE